MEDYSKMSLTELLDELVLIGSCYEMAGAEECKRLDLEAKTAKEEVVKRFNELQRGTIRANS